MTVADYRNLRADQKNNDIVALGLASEQATGGCTCLAGIVYESLIPWGVPDPWCPKHGEANVPLTRTKDDRLTRREGE